MKMNYCKPLIKVQSINMEDIMENTMSMPLMSNEEYIITEDDQILVNKQSVWEE